MTGVTASTGWLSRFGAKLIGGVEGVGRFSTFAMRGLRAVGHIRSWSRRDRFAAQLFTVGTASVPVIMITGAFIGMILAIEGFLQFKAAGLEQRYGGVINISVTKQIGPVLAAVILAGRVGCSLTAELGSMRVTEQLDAMRAMGADPSRVLVAPRVIACAVMAPPLTIISNLCGVAGGWLVCTKFYDADPTLYWEYSGSFVSWYDISGSIVKSFVFGVAIGLIACYKGFTCRPGARGVGRATTESFVVAFIAIIVLNLMLAHLLNQIDLIRNGGVVDSVFV
ncbi:MAG: ABC transporter permease [Planctomycetota bacterium]